MPYVGEALEGGTPGIARRMDFTYSAGDFAAGVTRATGIIPCQGMSTLRLTVACVSLEAVAVRADVALFVVQQIRLFVGIYFNDLQNPNDYVEVFSAYPQVIPYDIAVTGGVAALGNLGYGLRKYSYLYTVEMPIAGNGFNIGLNTSQISASQTNLPTGGVFRIEWQLNGS